MRRVIAKEFLKFHRIEPVKILNTIKDRVVLKKIKCSECNTWALVAEHNQHKELKVVCLK